MFYRGFLRVLSSSFLGSKEVLSRDLKRFSRCSTEVPSRFYTGYLHLLQRFSSCLLNTGREGVTRTFQTGTGRRWDRLHLREVLSQRGGQTADVHEAQTPVTADVPGAQTPVTASFFTLPFPSVCVSLGFCIIVWIEAHRKRSWSGKGTELEENVNNRLFGEQEREGTEERKEERKKRGNHRCATTTSIGPDELHSAVNSYSARRPWEWRSMCGHVWSVPAKGQPCGVQWRAWDQSGFGRAAVSGGAGWRGMELCAPLGVPGWGWRWRKAPGRRWRRQPGHRALLPDVELPPELLPLEPRSS